MGPGVPTWLSPGRDLAPSSDLRAPVLILRALLGGCGTVASRPPGTPGPSPSPSSAPAPLPCRKDKLLQFSPSLEGECPGTQGWGQGRGGTETGEYLVGQVLSRRPSQRRDAVSWAGRPDGAQQGEGTESRCEGMKIGNTWASSSGHSWEGAGAGAGQPALSQRAWPFFQILHPPGTRTSAKVGGLRGGGGHSGAYSPRSGLILASSCRK